MSTFLKDIKASLSLSHSMGLLTILENNPKRLKRVKFLNELFKSEGYELRIAGGAVRDILRGIEPQDIDFATTARPEQSLDILKKHEDLLRIIVTSAGQRHGTVKVKFKEIEIDFKRLKSSSVTNQDKEVKTINSISSTNKPEYDEENPYDITTLRCDNATDGRHAEVEFVNDWRVDSERRDLTINAMFLTINEGKLIDYFGGESDLRNGVVRFVGNADMRLKEDYLRILRFFRFWSRYGRGKKPDPDTTLIIKQNLEGLDMISGERLWQEIKKTLYHIPCYEVVKLMLELKLFEYVGLRDKNLNEYEKYVERVLAEVELVQKNVQVYLKTIQDAGNQSQKVVMKEMVPIVLFASIVQDTNMCLNAHARMKFSNLEKDSILYIIENKDKDQSIEQLKYMLTMANSPERPQLLYKIRTLSLYKGALDIINELESWQVPIFPITGLIVSQEVKRRRLPGDKIKHILESVKIIWANSEYTLSKSDLEREMSRELDELERLRIK